MSIASKHYRNLLSRLLWKVTYLCLIIVELGKALCVICGKELVYGAKGVITILDHLQRKSHVEKYILKKSNFSLLGQCTSSSTYGLHPMYEEFMLPEKPLPFNSNI